MVDRDDLAFFARAMTPSKATTDAGWARLQASIEAAEVEAPIVLRRRAPRVAMWIGASVLAAAAVGVLAFGIDRERWTADEAIDRSQAVDAREEAEARRVETRQRSEAPLRASADALREAPAVPNDAALPNDATAVPNDAAPLNDATALPNDGTALPSTDERIATSRHPRSERSENRPRPHTAPRDPTPPAATVAPTTDASPPELQRPAEDPFALEAASLRRVERAIAASDLPRARVLLRAHRERFTNGILAREASLLQVVIACEAADTDAAAAAANQHASAFPNDPTTARLRKQVCSKR